MKRIIITATIIIGYLQTTSHLQAQVGKVGINTTTPQAILHVKDSSVLFSGVSSDLLPASPGNPPASGPGVRMMWYSDKAAFRAGRSGNNWDKDSIGDYSIAAGYSTMAKGNHSTAFGIATKALGNASSAMGAYTVAIGDFSTALGRMNYAEGDYSTALGENTLASGNHSTTLGEGTIASGNNSTAIGLNSIASAFASTAMGNSTTSSGYNSTALGIGTTARSFGSTVIGRFNDSIATSNPASWVSADPLFIIGNGSSYVSRSNAMTVLKNGNVGIGTTNPNDILHLAKASSGATPNGDASLILEDNNNNYIQFISSTGSETGILHGRPGSVIRGGIIFDAQSNMRLRTGGNNTRIFIDSTGNTGIGTLSPLVKMQVNGGLALDNASATATSQNFLVTVDNRTYIRVSSNDVPANRFIELSNGLTVGQLLILECSASSGNGITVQDNPGSGNTRTAGNFAMTLGDTITLIWNGDDWVELNRSDN